MDFDLILKGGWAIDGTGGPAFLADAAAVLNVDRKIFEVGHLGDSSAKRIIDATGLTIVPGFIDAHVHGDLMLLADPIHLPALRQGVTTYIIGQDGSSFAPGSASTIDYMRRYTAGFNGNPADIDYNLNGVEEYLARFDRQVAINVAGSSGPQRKRPDGGHGARPSGRPATTNWRRLQRLVRRWMDAGAVGPFDRALRLPAEQVRHGRPGDRRSLRGDRLPTTVSTSPTMRAYGQNAAIGMEEVYEVDRLQRSGVACAHLGNYNGPANLLLPLIDRTRARDSPST